MDCPAHSRPPRLRIHPWPFLGQRPSCPIHFSAFFDMIAVLAALALLASACGGDGGGGKRRAPAAPDGIRAYSDTSGQITVEWNAVNRATSYDLYWSTSPGVTKTTGTKVEGVSSPYSHTGLLNATIYHYVVTAVAGGRESVESAEALAMPLASPATVTVSGGTGELTTDWAPVTGAVSYNLYWSASPGVTKATGTLMAAVSSPHRHVGLVNGTTYHYVVTAANSVGGGAESSESSEVSATPLAAPTGVNARADVTGEITVDWSTVSGATSYTIYWGTAPGVTRGTGTPVSTATSPLVHTGRLNGTVYFYVVTASDGSVESAESTEVCAPPLEIPTSVSARGKTSEVFLDWDPVPWATAYNVYWDTSPAITKATATLIPGVVPPYFHTGLTNGSPYYYLVTAVNAVGGGAESTPSPAVSAVPLAPPTGLTGTPSFSEVSLDWSVVTGATSYNIYWSMSPGVTKASGIPISGVTPPYPHVGLENTTTYYYIVTAVSTAGGGSESDESAETYATPDVFGVLDTSFGGQGWVTHRNAAGGDLNDEGHGIALDSVGRILVTGHSGNPVPDWDLVIWRYLEDGTLDAGFGGVGWVTHDNAGGGFQDQPVAIAVDLLDRAIVTGTAFVSAGNPDMAIWRYAPTGTLDPGLGGGGFILHGNAAGGNSGDKGVDIVFDSAGMYLVTGGSFNASGDQDMVIWRYDSSGILDPSFGSGGIVLHASAAGGTGIDCGRAITLDASGRIVVAGLSANALGNNDLAIWRLYPDGTLDPSFGTGGIVVHDGAAGGNARDTGHGIVLDASGRIVVGGFSENASGDFDMAIWRCTADGTLDAAFGLGGFVVHDNAAGGMGDDVAFDITLDDAGRMLAAGFSRSSAGNADMTIWRYLPDGTQDTTFGSGGVVTHDNAAGGMINDGGRGITLDSSGRILLAGHSTGLTGYLDMVIWRFK